MVRSCVLSYFTLKIVNKRDQRSETKVFVLYCGAAMALEVQAATTQDWTYHNLFH